MRILATLLLAICLTGCASMGREVDPNAVAKIQKGQTTRAEVLALLGQPQAVSNDGNGGEAFTYSYTHAQANGASYIPIAGAFVGGVDSRSQVVIVAFNTKGVVREVKTVYGTNKLGHG